MRGTLPKIAVPLAWGRTGLGSRLTLSEVTHALAWCEGCSGSRPRSNRCGDETVPQCVKMSVSQESGEWTTLPKIRSRTTLGS